MRGYLPRPTLWPYPLAVQMRIDSARAFHRTSVALDNLRLEAIISLWFMKGES